MKITLLNYSTGLGGASISAYRLYQGLKPLNPETFMIVGINDKENPEVIAPKSRFDKAWIRLAPMLDEIPKRYYRQRKMTPYSLQWIPDRLNQKLEKIEPDIINLHWITRGFMQIETLKKMAKPIVWTLHDMWAFTGGCHYSSNCQRYKESCGRCPQLSSNQLWDLSHWIWQKKQKAWSSLNLTLVSPSQWLANCARQSSLFQNLPINVIPNGINTQIYRKIDKIIARNLLNFPQNKLLILFGSVNPNSDPRKGFHLLLSALKSLSQLAQLQEIEIVVFGDYQPNNHLDIELPFKTCYLGKLNDDISLVIAYNTADVFVAPSLEDNLPNTILEALACGVPCVGFQIGGIPDMIDHKTNGYLAQPYEIFDLAKGIQWVLENQERRNQLSQSARQTVLNKFTLEQQAHRYLSLFQTLVY